jgi:NAD(P)-dependent dehydrogenase (short-subunit alcohol dehydrogenase family)
VKTALVLGGTGAVGREVVRALARAGARVTFTFHRGEALAQTLAREVSGAALPLDLADPTALPALVRAHDVPDVAVHCAAVLRPGKVDRASDDDWETTLAINARSAFALCRDLGGRMAERGAGDIVLTGALTGGQSLPMPAAFAASQGLLSSLAMAAARDLGPRGVRVNLVALGLLDAGLSLGLDAKLRDEFRAFSALRRFGTPAEVARTIAWLALENSYVNGKVVAVNGGL